MAIAHALHKCARGLCFQFGAVEHPRTVWKWMLCLDVPSFNGKTQCSRADAQEIRRVCEIHPALAGRLFDAIASNAVVAAQCGHAFARPTIATSREQTVAVEHA